MLVFVVFRGLARDTAALRTWYADHLGVDVGDWGGRQFDWTAGGSTTWAVFDTDTEASRTRTDTYRARAANAVT